MTAPSTIHDLAYRRYEGPRTASTWRFWVIARASLRMQLRLRAVKAFLLLGLLFLAGYAVALFFVASMGALAREAAGSDAVRRGLDGVVASGVFGGQSLSSLLLVMACGAPAISSDLGAGAFQFYFSRPVSPAQYLAGRIVSAAGWAAVLSFLALGLLTLERLALTATDIPHGLLASAKIAGPLALRLLVLAAVALGVSSLTRKRGLAQALFVGVVIGSRLVTLAVAAASHKRWVSVLGVTEGADMLGIQLLGRGELHGLQAAAPGVAAAAWLALGLGLAYYRLANAEVVRG